MRTAARAAEARFAAEGMTLTLGGEPTFVPLEPVGSEWSVTAVGPTKLRYARAVAQKLLAGPLQGGVSFFCPGKLYPGEVNPRWVIKVLASRDGTDFFPQGERRARPSTLQKFGEAICAGLGVRPRWVSFEDPCSDDSLVLAMPLDHDGTSWVSAPWPLAKKHRKLLFAEGPAGLRLPLDHFPVGVSKRVLTIAWRGRWPSVFFPPLLQAPFLELVAAVGAAGPGGQSGSHVSFEGYVPSDEAGLWTTCGITSDPGVLEINLPASRSWEEYSTWLDHACQVCDDAGLRSWKKPLHAPPEGTGGGNHILWGGPDLESNPFFTRPRWLVAILRYWQRHPALSYAFTGCYVGPSSQAPRPDESARDHEDLEMAYRFLENLPPGDHRSLINETLRHLHTDITGNTHRSEISFDKFWNPGWLGGSLGLIEFRAFESLPRSDWMAATALLLTCIAARSLKAGKPSALKKFGNSLHDQYFLPSVLWTDLKTILQDLAEFGFALEESVYREIWEWRFPELLDWEMKSGSLHVRSGLEGWPLLCETPLHGGTTSRFVDTSMHRLEFLASGEFIDTHEIYVAGRRLPLRVCRGTGTLAGLRFRRTNLHPSLHPGLPPQLPLDVCILELASHRVVAEFTLGPKDSVFRKSRKDGVRKLGGNPCRPRCKGEFTCDLRLGP